MEGNIKGKSGTEFKFNLSNKAYYDLARYDGITIKMIGETVDTGLEAEMLSKIFFRAMQNHKDNAGASWKNNYEAFLKWASEEIEFPVLLGTMTAYIEASFALSLEEKKKIQKTLLTPEQIKKIEMNAKQIQRIQGEFMKIMASGLIGAESKKLLSPVNSESKTSTD